MNAPKLSVVICTHNPRAAFMTRTLDGLRAQSLDALQWELIVIDNASTPPLGDDLAWHPRGRIVREEKLGLTHARLRAIRETGSDLLVLVDDDNVLAPDYLERALAISHQWPILGAWGGQCVPEFEETPAEWTHSFWNWIAIREFDADRWSNIPGDQGAAPCGAGMCVRRNVARAYVERLERDPARRSLDRTGGHLFGGGDTDLAMTACDLGLGNGLFAALKLTHIIPKTRLEERYLLNLVRSMTYSATMLDFFHGRTPSRLSRSQRLLKWWELRHIAGRDRRFENARREGGDAAIRDMERMKAGREPLGLSR